TAAADEYEGYKNTVAESYYLLLAERLAEEGHQEESAELSRNILSGEYASHAKSAALAILLKMMVSRPWMTCWMLRPAPTSGFGLRHSRFLKNTRSWRSRNAG